MINQRASQRAVVNQIMKNANGIGQSKIRARENHNSSTTGQNGQTISTKAHSLKAMDNLRSVSNQYTSFLKDNYGSKIVNYISAETMKEFITVKFEQGSSEGTINTYLSTLGKLSDNLNQLGVHRVSREEITAYRNELREFGHTLKANHVDRSNGNPLAILEQMRGTPYSLSSDLSYFAGLRADDTINITDKITINENNSLHIHGSKNGLDYNTKILSQDLIDRVREAIENGYKVNYNEYRETLKEATEATGQEWHGTHSLRYDYAQREKEDGSTLSEISASMGHSREEITLHYLKR